MAVKTLYVLNTTAATPNFWGNLQEGGSPPTAGLSTYGWGVAKTASPSFWPARLGAVGNVSSSSSGTTSFIDSKTGPTKGTGTSNTSTLPAGDSFVAGPYTGTFAATAWQFDWKMKTGTAGGIGRIRMRVWKSTNADGSSATELTAGALVGATVTLLTSGDVNSSISWSPGAITLAGHYLFFQIEWNETTAGSTATDTVQFSIGTALITTPDFGTTAAAIVLRRRTNVLLRR